MDAAVHLVAQSIVHGEVLRGFPRILKIEVVRLAPYPGFVEFASHRRNVSRRHDVVGIRRRSQQSCERVWQRLTHLNVVGSARRLYELGRTSFAATKLIQSVGIHPEDRRIAIDPYLSPPLECMGSMGPGKILLELIKVAVRPEDRSG